MSESNYPTEVWKAIPGYEGRYSVSNFGRVVSHNYKRLGMERVLKAMKSRAGYRHVKLPNWRGKPTCWPVKIHRLVMLAFVGPPPIGKAVVNHLNQNKSDNRLENLEWCSPSENLLHSFANSDRRLPIGARNGQHLHPEKTARGERHGLSKLTEIEVRAIRASRESYSRLAVRFGVWRQTIAGIKTRKTWIHI